MPRVSPRTSPHFPSTNPLQNARVELLMTALPTWQRVVNVWLHSRCQVPLLNNNSNNNNSFFSSQVVDENNNYLSSVLLSLSGDNQYRSNNLIKENGMMVFSSLVSHHYPFSCSVAFSCFCFCSLVSFRQSMTSSFTSFAIGSQGTSLSSSGDSWLLKNTAGMFTVYPVLSPALPSNPWGTGPI